MDKFVRYEHRDGAELIEYESQDGASKIIVSNTLNNGLRIGVWNDDLVDWAEFDIEDKSTALEIAGRLTEWCERMAAPPSTTGNKRG
jgi:hypothetical protein